MISNLAYIHPDAKLGKNITIEPFAYVAADVVLGDECWIGPGAVLMGGTRMGKGCKVHSGAVIAGIPQDLKFKGEYTTVEIGDNNTIREGVTINRGTVAKGKTVIGDNNLLMTNVHVGHDCEIGDYCVLVNGVSLGGEVIVEDWAIIGGHSAIHQFVRIGAHVMLAGGSLVIKDVPPFVKGANYPVSFVGVNFVGLRRRGYDSEKVTQIQDTLRLIFQSGYPYSKACEVVEKEVPQSEERNMVIDFIRNSKRGIIKPFNSLKVGDDE